MLYFDPQDWGNRSEPFRDNQKFWTGLGEIGRENRLRYREFLNKATGARVLNTLGLTQWERDRIETLYYAQAGYMTVLDAEQFSSEFVATLIQDCPSLDFASVGAERTFSKGRDENFGAIVSKRLIDNKAEDGEYSQQSSHESFSVYEVYVC